MGSCDNNDDSVPIGGIAVSGKNEGGGFTSQGVGKKASPDNLSQSLPPSIPRQSFFQQIVGAFKGLASDTYSALTQQKVKPNNVVLFSPNKGPPPPSGAA